MKTTYTLSISLLLVTGAGLLTSGCYTQLALQPEPTSTVEETAIIIEYPIIVEVPEQTGPIIIVYPTYPPAGESYIPVDSAPTPSPAPSAIDDNRRDSGNHRNPPGAQHDSDGQRRPTTMERPR